MKENYEFVVIGGGVVGLAIIKQLTCISRCAGATCLVEGDANLCGRASGHNSGIACTGVDAPLFSLERACVRDSISVMRHHNKMFNLPSRSVGSLVCDWGEGGGEEGGEKLEEILEVRVGRESKVALSIIVGLVHHPTPFFSVFPSSIVLRLVTTRTRSSPLLRY